ncbi:MAG: hypothetical protein WC985_00270 [Thermoplasmata archaeon]
MRIHVTREVLAPSITALVLTWWVVSYQLAMNNRPAGSYTPGWILPVFFFDLLVGALGASAYVLLGEKLGS